MTNNHLKEQNLFRLASPLTIFSPILLKFSLFLAREVSVDRILFTTLYTFLLEEVFTAPSPIFDRGLLCDGVLDILKA